MEAAVAITHYFQLKIIRSTPANETVRRERYREAKVD